MSRIILGLVLMAAVAPRDDREARELLREVHDRLAQARTLRIEGRVSTEQEEERTDATFSVRMRGTDQWALEVQESRTQRDSISGFNVCATSDGRKIVLAGAPSGAALTRLDPRQVGRILRGVLLSTGISSLEGALSEVGEAGPSFPAIEDVKDGGRERVGDVDARIVEGTLRQGTPLQVRLWVDPSARRPLRLELTHRGLKTVETYTAFAFDEALPDSDFIFQSLRRLGRAQTAELGRCVALFSSFTGRYPRTLDDLVHRPADLEPEIYYPEGGFVLGGRVPRDPWGRPFELRRDRGRLRVVGLGADGRPGGIGDDEDSEAVVPPLSGRAVGAPTDRLRKHYTARVQLQLLAGAVRLYSRVTGGLPPKEASLWERPEESTAWPEGGYLPGGRLPLDPWGEPYRLKSEPGMARVQVRNPSLRNLTAQELTPEEARALMAIARIRLPGDERRKVRELLDRLSEDDLEARDRAVQELKGWGAVIHPELEERLKTEKDAETCLRIEAIRRGVPVRSPAWSKELSPLEIAITAHAGVEGDPALLQSCCSNLSRLWQLQMVYRMQFGGRAKRMPEETGKEFWLALTRTSPPLIEAERSGTLELLVCPASGVKGQAGDCTYRGPARKVSEAAGGDVVGMCDDEAHGDVAIILRKSGTVTIIRRTDDLYGEALEHTGP